MRSKAAKRNNRRILASMTDQKTPEAIRSRVMDLERMSVEEIAALPRPKITDQVEVMAQAQVMFARMAKIMSKPGGKEALQDAWEQAKGDVNLQPKSFLAKIAMGAVDGILGKSK